jgi:hypothetical protein
MSTRDNGQDHAACTLAYEALQVVEAHTRAGYLRCPVCGLLPAEAHADDCALARALAALGGLEEPEQLQDDDDEDDRDQRADDPVVAHGVPLLHT